MNTSVTRIFYNANTENLLVNNNGATGLTQVGSGFMPLSGSDLQAMANLGVNVYKTSVTVGQSVSHQPGQAVLRSKNLTVVRPLWSTASSSLMLNLTATRSSGNDSVLASFQFTFFTPTLTVTATTGENYSGAPDQPSTRHLDSSVIIDKRYTWNIQNLLDIQGGYYNMLGAQTYTGSINYQSAFVNSMFNVAQTRLSSGESRTNYGLNLYSSVSYTEGDFAFGNNQNYLSGVIVRVKAANKGDVVVYVNDQPTAIVRTNRSQTIFLQPYKTYTFTINPVGSTLYSFDHSPKQVTLYLGNMKHLDWSLAKQFILFAEIVDKEGKPLSNLLLENRSEFDTTDDGGYLQAGLDTDTLSLHFRAVNGDVCVIKLPDALQIENGIVTLDKPLVCDLQADTGEKAGASTPANPAAASNSGNTPKSAGNPDNFLSISNP